MTIGKTALRTGVLLAMALGMVACSDDTTGPDEPTLTLEESEALLEAMYAIGQTGIETELISPTINITEACAGGGTATVTGTLLPSGTATATALAMDLTIVPMDCVETARGRTFTLSGAPSLRQTGTTEFSMPEELTLLFELDWAIFGTLAYELESRSGTCDVSVRVVSQVDFSALTQTGSASGTLCGHTMDVDLSGPVIPEP